MTNEREFREDLRGMLRETFSEKVRAMGVAYARNPKAAEKARRQYERGASLTNTAIKAYKKNRRRWVLAEYRKLQLKSWSSKAVLKPEWARSENRMMARAERNVFQRHQTRLTKIDAITRREVARVRREHAPARSRAR